MKKSFKKIAVLLITLIFAIGTVGFPYIAEAKVKVGVPQMKKWYKSYDSSTSPTFIGDGVRYTLEWKKVKGADGYQVQKYSRSPYSNWYKFPTVSQATCSTSIEFSHISLEFKARVRAYKIVKGKRVYGKWSKMVKNKVVF